MTGNVNIYICSEANDTGQVERSEQKLKAQARINASSDTSTEYQSNEAQLSSSRYGLGGGSASLRKLIGDIRERRRKAQPFCPVSNEWERERGSGADVRDGVARETWRTTTEMSDSNSDSDKCGRKDVKTLGGLREERKDTASRSAGDDGRTRPGGVSSSSRGLDDTDDTDFSLSSVTEPHPRHRRRGDGVCAEIGDTRFRSSILNRRAQSVIAEKSRTDCRVTPRRSVECGRGQRHAAHVPRSMCGCIAEEEEGEAEAEDRRANGEKMLLPENLHSTPVICNESARAQLYATSLNNAGRCFERAPISKSTPRVTECPGRSVVQNLPRDIAVCGTISAESAEEARETAACSRQKPDYTDEAIRKLPHSDFAERDEVEEVVCPLSANGRPSAKDRLAKEKGTDSHLTNLNSQRENAVEAERVTLRSFDGDVVIPDLHLDGPRSTSIEGRPVPTGPIRDFEPLSRVGDSARFSHALQRVHQLRATSRGSNARKSFESPPVDRGESGARGRLSPRIRPTPAPLLDRDFTSIESEQPGEEVALKETKREDSGALDTMRPLTERDPKDTLLYHSLKKLLRVIRHRRAARRTEDARETERNRSDSVKRTEKDYEEAGGDIGEGAHGPRPQLLGVNKHETAGDAESQGPAALGTGAATVSKEAAEEADITGADRAASLKPKLLRIIAAKRSHLGPTETAADGVEPRERVDRGEISAEIVTDGTDGTDGTDDTAAIFVRDAPKDLAGISEGGFSGDVVADETTELRREPLARCECGPRSESLNSGLRSVVKRAERNDDILLEDCFRERKQIGAEAKEEEWPRVACFDIDESSFELLRNVSSRSESPRVCTNRHETREMCKYGRAVTRFHCCRYDEECGCGTCECRCAYRRSGGMKGKTISPHASPDRCDEASPMRSRRADRAGDREWKRCRDTGSARRCNKPMICLYCDDPRGECTCRAPIGKCLRCGLPSDVCDCQNDRGHDRDAREHVVGTRFAHKGGGSIRVTGWKPKKEMRRYFARNYRNVTKDCRCGEKTERQQPPEGLPYQRLSIFSDVMNELQRKMNGSVCCCCCRCRCRCRCSSDNEGKERRTKDRA